MGILRTSETSNSKPRFSHLQIVISILPPADFSRVFKWGASEVSWERNIEGNWCNQLFSILLHGLVVSIFNLYSSIILVRS